LCIFFVLITSAALSDSVRISQIDTNSLLFDQKIKLYLSITNDLGKPVARLTKPNFSVHESTNGKNFNKTRTISNFQTAAHTEENVAFLLLVDNSESMYWTMEGKKTDDVSKRRITYAQKAIRSFLGVINNPEDKVGIASYNSYYTPLIKPSNDLVAAKNVLKEIKRPTGDAIYTEIYGSLAMAVDEFNTVRGRKAIIILSDGVNNPSYKHTNVINTQFGEKNVSYKKPLDALQLEGISLYVINFGKKNDKKDRYLNEIAKQSGGVTFDAHNSEELEQIYLTVMDQIKKEYVISYVAGMEPADKKFVRVKYSRAGQTDSAVRYYFSGTVFGQPQSNFNPFILVLFFIACGSLWGISKLKFERQSVGPAIEILNAGAGNISTQVLSLDNEETIIGCSENADMTIAGVPAIQENHATIVFDKKSSRYTLKGEGTLMVNNKLITTKVLEPGDLINIDGTTMVFDEGTGKEKR
jgi:Ca-activated chloride channel family protein